MSNLRAVDPDLASGFIATAIGPERADADAWGLRGREVEAWLVIRGAMGDGPAADHLKAIRGQPRLSTADFTPHERAVWRSLVRSMTPDMATALVRKARGTA